MLPRERIILILVLIFSFYLFVDLETPLGNYLWEQRTQRYDRYSFQDKNLKMGYLNRRGRVIIPPQFSDGIKYFSEGLAPVETGDRWGYIDHEGNFLIKPRFSKAEEFKDGLALVAEQGPLLEKKGFINTKGETVIPTRYIDAKGFSQGLAAVKIQNKWGYIDPSGELRILPQFDDAQTFSEGLAAVKLKNKWGYINESGATVIDFKFDGAQRFSSGLAAVSIGSIAALWGYINHAGEFIVKAQYDKANVFSEGFAAVRQGVRSSYINPKGEVIIGSDFYMEIRNFSDGLAAVRVKKDFSLLTHGQWGFIDKNGKFVIEPKFDWASDFQGGLARVGMEKKQIKRGYINQSGRFIWDPAGWEQKAYVRHLVGMVSLFFILGICFIFYSSHSEYSRRLGILKRQSIKRKGTLEFRGLFFDPRLSFIQHCTEFKLSRVEKSRDYQFPEILIQADLPNIKDHFASFHIKLDSRFASTPQKSVLGGSQFIRLVEIDEADDKEYLSRLLTPQIREKLVQFQSAGYFFRVSIVNGKFIARFDGVPTRDQEYDWIIEMAVMFYDKMRELG